MLIFYHDVVGATFYILESEASSLTDMYVDAVQVNDRVSIQVERRIFKLKPSKFLNWVILLSTSAPNSCIEISTSLI